ncbi:methyl-accepting chemotaxis protein [Celerinatantimonas diazotrophica]|uniref:Methyl-accepting chemotaxis protein n=1 Tax=Celerinatantimonas diazotrophica TaxID=412034 RepID=A0A4R1K4E2_9GAMM|nr:methyl-accepting chemotaxis protein [Celerinatantimonas diazotrophica]TCK58988.1 methyl-accepting chemotaxis protein [Celerinatantimonas diazotrophica]CAG9297623.1 hypothetical protein CEDIAZO_02811 [Celerinatantimonas diazotrophica]
MTFKRQMLLLLTGIGLIPMMIVSAVSIYIASTSIEQQVFSQLDSIRQMKSTSLKEYLGRLRGEVDMLAGDPALRESLQEFDHDFRNAKVSASDAARYRQELKNFYMSEFLPRLQKNRPLVSSAWVDNMVGQLNDREVWLQHRFLVANPHPVGSKDKLHQSKVNDDYDQHHKRLHGFLRDVQKEYGFYDIFLINREGEVLYSVYKEVDFATSLEHGPYKDTNLAAAFRKADKASQGQVVISDFKIYRPSYDGPAGFIAAPVFDNNGKHIGVIAAQFPLDKLNSLMAERNGLGRSGETLIIGDDHLLRTDSYRDPRKYSVLQSFLHPQTTKITSEASDRALAGQTGLAILPDYLGQDALTAYAPVKFDGLNWAILVKIDADEALATEYHLIEVAVCLIAGAIVIVVLIAIWFTKMALKPLGGEPVQMQRIVKAIADGNLNVDIPVSSPNSVAGAMHTMTHNLKQLVGNISEGASEQHAIAQRLSSVAVQTNQVLHEQVQQTSQVATAVYEMTESFREVGNNIQTAVDASANSQGQIEQSTEEVVRSSDELHHVADEFKVSAQTVDQLTQRVADISSVLSSIQKIADQTNLLALNAAIEAARAGEHGRGFSVVADEVRALAKNTQKETEQITQIIQSLTNEAANTQKQMHTSVERAETMCHQAAATADKLKAAAASLDEVNRMNDSIASASEEQNNVATEISMNVETLNSSITQTEESMSEIEKSVHDIAQSSEKLRALIQTFKV